MIDRMSSGGGVRFGRLKCRFPLIAVPRQQSTSARIDAVWTCVLLHNFLIDERDEEFIQPNTANSADKSLEGWINLADSSSDVSSTCAPVAGPQRKRSYRKVSISKRDPTGSILL